MTIRTIYFIICCLTTSACFAQTEKQAPRPESNQLKTSLVDVARGTAGVYWEHIFRGRTSIEFGVGLTFDDMYSLAVYEGHEYSKRYKPQDTRFMGAFAYKFRPLDQFPNLFFGAECKYRRYYAADVDFFIENGVWNGVDRKETNTKLIFGGTWYPNSWNFLVEYYAGYGWFHSHSKWHYLDWDEHKYYGGTVLKDQGSFVVGLKIGYEFRKK